MNVTLPAKFPVSQADFKGRSEIMNMHKFKSLRHFPELAGSLSDECIKAQKDISLSVSMPYYNKIKPVFRKVKKSTAILDALCQSSAEEFHNVKDFRKMLIEARQRQRIEAQESISIRKQSIHEVEPIESAEEKMARVAFKLNDARSRTNNDLQGFLGGPLLKHELERQLCIAYNLFFTKPEMDALFDKIDANHSGTVKPVEFLSYFSQLGYQFSERMRKKTVENSTLKLEKEMEMKRTEEERLVKKFDFHAEEHSQEKEEEVLSTLRRFALKYDVSNELDRLRLKPFRSRMTPAEFKAQIENAFDIYLSPAEATVLVHKFSTLPEPHCIDGEHFLTEFAALQRQAKQEYKIAMARNAKAKKAIMDKSVNIDALPKLLGR